VITLGALFLPGMRDIEDDKPLAGKRPLLRPPVADPS